MRLYFDTAHIAKCYLNEPDGKKVRKLATGASELSSSAWCVAELACVFQRRIREGFLSQEQSVELRDVFLKHVRDQVWTLFPVSDRLLFRVAEITASLPRAVHLRAGDAVHLVTAQQAGFTQIWSNDRHLLAAAMHLGLEGRTV